MSDSRTHTPTLIAYQDPAHEGNSARYHTGKRCREKGCKEPAGTAWSPYWCFVHNVERMDRIGAALNDLVEKARFGALADKACADWRRTCGAILRERDAILRAAGGKITVTKEQLDKEQTHWSHQSHRDGSQTYQIDCGVGRASHDGLVEALRFYADTRNWPLPQSRIDGVPTAVDASAIDDMGDRVRRALEAAGIKTTEGTDER